MITVTDYVFFESNGNKYSQDDILLRPLTKRMYDKLELTKRHESLKNLKLDFKHGKYYIALIRDSKKYCAVIGYIPVKEPRKKAGLLQIAIFEDFRNKGLIFPLYHHFLRKAGPFDILYIDIPVSGRLMKYALDRLGFVLLPKTELTKLRKRGILPSNGLRLAKYF